MNTLATLLSKAPSDNAIVTKAPGRINLIGEHTDYNGGLVLPGAIDKYFYCALVPRSDEQVNLTALDLNEKHDFTLSALEKTEKTWANFVIGILLEFRQRNVALKGFDMILSSDIPVGAGMSSSSGLECACLFALNHYYKSDFDNWTLIKMSQASNHNFLGIKGGIMDQFASLFGKEDQVMLLNCNSFTNEYFPISQSKFSWLLIDSSVKHDNLTSGYNQRVLECNSGLRSIQKLIPDIENLGGIKNFEELCGVIFQNDLVRDRVKFVIEENSRVIQFAAALQKENYIECGKLLYQSHQGLSEMYQVSCAELDYLVELLKDDKRILGSRMMGGGFGGCTINLVEKDAIEIIKNKVQESYFNRWIKKPKFYDVKISGGAGLIKS